MSPKEGLPEQESRFRQEPGDVTVSKYDKRAIWRLYHDGYRTLAVNDNSFVMRKVELPSDVAEEVTPVQDRSNLSDYLDENPTGV